MGRAKKFLKLLENKGDISNITSLLKKGKGLVEQIESTKEAILEIERALDKKVEEIVGFSSDKDPDDFIKELDKKADLIDKDPEIKGLQSKAKTLKDKQMSLLHKLLDILRKISPLYKDVTVTDISLNFDKFKRIFNKI